MQWIKITDSTELPKEEVLVCTTTRTLFLAINRGSNWYETFYLDPITNVTHYTKVTLPCE